MNKKQIFLLILIGIIFFLPAIFPLVHKGFFLTDDGEWMIIRFTAFYQALHDGQFPVRFLHRLNFDYGYPVATFLYPGFMYAGVLLHILKIGFVDSVKIILGLSLFGTTLFTYFWLTKLFTKRSAAMMGAFASLYFPYHFYDSYTRGSVGEIFALVWVPFILWMIEKKNISFVSLGIFFLILSHNTMALLFLPILFIYALLRKLFSFHHLLFSFVGAILLGSFFILPIIFELPLTVFSHTTVAQPSNYFANFNLIGLSSIIIFFLALGVAIMKNKFIKTHKNITLFFLVLTFLAIFFSSSLSSIFWQIIPSAFIQFPFRLLSYLTISLAFLTAFIVSELHPKFKQIVAAGIVLVLMIFSSYQFISPKIYFDKGDGYYATNDATTTVQDEYMPVWVKEKPLKRPAENVEIIKGNGKILNNTYNNKQVVFTVATKEQSTVRVNTIYWPGWKVFVDNSPIPFSYDNPMGVIEFVVLPGTHQVKAVFEETGLRLFADSLSLISFIVLSWVCFKKKKQ